MAIGFVLIKTAPAAEREVYDKVKDMENVMEVHSLFGEYDLIIKLQAQDFNSLGQTVVDSIRSIEGVEDTKTLTGIEF
ncbi:MAG: Lrp/AsnC ligand binding domain-containing protein [Candidatus Thermoplasmatota archaeon]|nr:Lrp/AsnC ligand binding domain-containing protein [Candidatus Thermoplasmatota archaeon]MBS3790386.1 Lrp/AsnC ligand binding domain-containing protein [Candidatus Thermoplasmatota archaeon]